MSIDLSLIKERISCVDYCRGRGLPISKSGSRCVSPLRAGAQNKTSFIVFDDWWYDYGKDGGTGGDVIDLCAMLEFGGDKGQAIRALAKKAGVDDDESSAAWLEYTQNLNNKIAAWHKNLSPEFRAYCNKRGIKDETIDRLRIGQTPDGRLCIPYYKGQDGYVCYYITRHMEGGACPDSKYMKMKIDDMNEHIPWGMWTLNRNKDLLVIAEGAFDVMSFEQEGYACLSAITGHFSAAQMPGVLRAARMFDKVFLVYDNDDRSHAGEMFTVKMAKTLFANNIPFIVGKTPPRVKDVSDYYKNGGDLQELITNAQDGVEALCMMIPDQNEFETIVRRACRYMTKAAVTVLFQKISKQSRWDEEWLKVLKQECSSCPSEDSIVKEVVKKYELKFHRSAGFVRYNGKYWEKIQDEEVAGYIDGALGVYRSGSKQTSILKLMRAEVHSIDLLGMNRHPVMNFINGTLELYPKILFREHRKDDYCTYCLDYPYDPDAKSSDWEQYLLTTTDYDDKKIALLQEFAGYAMFEDYPIHKALALIGDGRNGKSIYVNAIRDVYGASNVSTVSMSDLTKDFHAVDLKYSMLNIASETRSDVTGAEENFKKVTAGESIRDSYKGKDLMDFIPRAKWFMNCNNFMVSKTDSSDGWIERFCFCEFKLKFVEDPKLPNERLIDRTLKDRLQTQESLSAIFNWCLEGYKVLKATMKFTEPDDQKTTKEDFVEITNPLIVYVKEFDIDACHDHRITNKDIYANYVAWAAECNHRPLAKTQFEKRLPKAIQVYRPDIEDWRCGKIRGWQKVEDQKRFELL